MMGLWLNEGRGRNGDSAAAASIITTRSDRTEARPARPQAGRRGAAWALLLLACATLSACSALRTAYQQADVLLYWQIDRYLDVQSAQKPALNQAIAQWLAWHRRTQLDDYRQALVGLRQLAEAPPSQLEPPQLCTQLDDWRARIARAWQPAVPLLAPLLLTLQPAQLDHLARRYARDLDEFKDKQLQPDRAERAEAALARTVEVAEDYFGDLLPAQRDWLAQQLAASPYDAQRWLQLRQARQQATLRQLRAWQAQPPELAEVQAWLLRQTPGQLPSEAGERAWLQSLQQANCALAAGLHARSTPAQRRHLRDKLLGWEADLQALAAQPGQTAQAAGATASR